jgi:lipase maturation factor 1
VPLWSLNPIPSNNAIAMSPLVMWTIKWHLFRIIMGAGLIKFKANDRKWKDLTAMHYFYETQPVPNPLTRYFHWMPPLWHKCEVLSNHFVEVIAPWLLLIPASLMSTTWRRASGLIQLTFQAILILSGNLSFLNWLTMVPAILCLDDAFVSGLFGPATRQAAMMATATRQPTPMLRRLVSFTFLLFILQLSIPVVRNLCTKKQIMNTSYDPLRLVNTYGAFGVVNKHRDEFIILGSSDLQEWKEYEFKVKPGDVRRKPRWISPYHMRYVRLYSGLMWIK